MDSPTASLLPLLGLLILAAVLVTLYLLQARTLQRNFDTFREDAAKTLEVAVTMSRDELRANRERAAAGARELTEATQQMLRTSAETLRSLSSEAIRTVDLQATRQLSGSQASAAANTELLQSLAAHIATKDTAGYERVMAAAGTPVRSDPEAPPYAVPGEPEEVALLREQMGSEDAAASLLQMAMNGGRTRNASGLAGPYPGGAGSAES